MNVQFANPLLLFFLWLVPAAGAWWYAADRRREQRLEAFLSREMQRKLRPRFSRARGGWQAGLVLAALALALVAAARPQWGVREEVVFQRGRDLLIALDVSRSMLAADVHPNRLQRAKYDIMDLVKELQGDRAGLMAFRGKAVMLCPLTTDYAFLRQALDAVGPDSAPRGETDIGDAIGKAMESFDGETGTHKAVVLISDGEDLGGRALDAAAKAAARGIPIFTVGLGDRDGTRIPAGEGGAYVRHQGSEVVTRLNDDTLYAIATKTGGAYVPIATAGTAGTTLGTIYRDHLRKVAARDLDETRQRRRVERYQWFLFPAFLCLAAAALLSRGRLRTRPAPPRPESSARLLRHAAVLIAVALWAAPAAGEGGGPGTNAAPAVANVPPGRAGARVAQRLYRRGQYAAAADAYRRAAAEAGPKAQRDFRYNAAAALYRDGQFQPAADLFREIVLGDKEPDGSAAAGLGAALFRSAEVPGDAGADDLARRARLLGEAGEAFKEAARTRAEDTRARGDLGVVLGLLPEAKERAKIARLMAAHGQTPPGALAETMLMEQRALRAELMAAYTNDAPEQIAQLEALAKRQEDNADLWIPLKGGLLQAMAQGAADEEQQRQMATTSQFIETTRDGMRSAAMGMRDLDPAGFNSAVVSEEAVYQMWKGTASHPSLLREDLRAQTNVIEKAGADPDPSEAQRQTMKEEQAEALELTRLFVERFSREVPEGGSPADALAAGIAPPADAQPPVTSSNGCAPAISAEARAEILDLAAQAAAFQENALRQMEARTMAEALDQQRAAYDRLLKIRERLPKSPPQPQQDQKQDQKQDQNKGEKSPSGQQDQPTQEQRQNEPEPDASAEAEEQKAEEPDAAPAEEQEKKEDELSGRELRQLLDKALMREREHEAEKRRQRQQIPMSPSERDW